MLPLRIQLFGGLRLSSGGRELPSFATQKARDLFSFLALNHARRYPRDVLMGRFCGDAPERVARKNLRNDLWRIRSVVEPSGVERGWCLQVEGDEVAFNAGGGHWVDVAAFERKLDAAGPDRGDPLTPEGAEALRQAVALYGGDLLDGVYDDWCLFERERLRLRYVTALERLMRHHGQRGDWADAALHGQRLLACDPLREHVHRDLMRFYARMGDPAAALRQFGTCERLLRLELEVAPTAETLALRDEIRAGTHRAPSAPRPERGAQPADLLERLADVTRLLDDVALQLRRIARAIEHDPDTPPAFAAGTVPLA
jgi:DNA-binding SARP family transcriptional activator